MPYSIVTSKGQTTIPGRIRKALRIKPGDKLEYTVEGDHVTIPRASRHSRKGMSFAEIRDAAVNADRGRGGIR